MAMADDWNKPLTKAEMEAIRNAAGNEKRVRDGFWEKFRRIARHVPFAEDILAAYYCATDTGTSFRVRAMLFAALVYFLWPTNIIPRVAIAIGLFDEAAVLLVTIRTLGGAIKPEHREKARATLGVEMQAA